MKLCEKAQCSFQNWYPKFKRWSIKSVWEPVPDEVVGFLREDGVVIPKEATLDNIVDRAESDSEDSIDWGEQEEVMEPPSFPEFSSLIKEHMRELGGNVFVKLNWSAPNDAAWIASNSLRCNNIQDVYLLLKSSDKISKDLATDYSHRGPRYVLVLKQWTNIHPGDEFRCFISGGKMVAISQRNKLDYHSHIDQHKYDIMRDINEFHLSKVQTEFTLSNYTMDVVWSGSGGRVRILDFGTWGPGSGQDPYLFTWEELAGIEWAQDVSPEFRYIGEDTGIQPQLANNFGLPVELVNASEQDRRNILQLLQEQARP